MRLPNGIARKRTCALVMAGAMTGLVASPAQSAPGPEEIGAFSAPFREDGFDPERKTTAGCKKLDNSKFDCLPVGATSVVLTNRNVLYWNALEGFENIKQDTTTEVGANSVNDRSRVLAIDPDDPARSIWTEPTPGDGGANPNGNTQSDVGAKPDAEANDGSLFCSDQDFLADGRLLAVGGTDYYNEVTVSPGVGLVELEGLKNGRIFDPATNTWRQSGSMNYGRWYPSMLTLPDGKLLVMSGVTKLLRPVYTDEKNRENTGGNVRQLETFDPATETWTPVGKEANRSLPLFPRVHLLPSGKVFYDSGGQAYNPFGESYDEALWNIAAVFDPGTKRWTDLGIPGLGTTTEPGFRGSTFSVMMPLKAPYTEASFLTAGGVLLTTPGSYLPTTTSRITTIRTEGGKETMTTRATGSLGLRRWYSSGVPLPDGSVLALSGADVDEVIDPGGGHSIRLAELFVPDGKGGGEWRKLGEAVQERHYHNTATLLHDGRVLLGGHAPIPNGYGKVETTEGFSNNFRDASFEIYSPPYLFRGARPTIGPLATDKVGYGTTLTVPTPEAGEIESVVLVRNPSVTHLVDGDQRTVELPIASRGRGALQVSVPDQTAVLPPGPYMLFVNKTSAKGPIPSVAAQVTVGRFPQAAAVAPQAAAVAPQAVAAPAEGSGELPATGGGTGTYPWIAPLLLAVSVGVLALRARARAGAA